MTLNIDGRGMLEVGIVTKRIEPMIAFYRDALGLPQVGEFEIPGQLRQVRFGCGQNVIKLVVNAKEPPLEAPKGGIPTATGFRFLTISVRNIEEATAACREAGYEIAIPVTPFAEGIQISMIEDPDGNWVELVENARLE